MLDAQIDVLAQCSEELQAVETRLEEEEERLAATWGVWGTTLYSADLRAAVGSPFILQIKKPPDVPDELKKVIASSEF